MKSNVYTGDRDERATGTDYLEKRLEINRAYSSADFNQWLFEHLDVKDGQDILDVGCGSGAQALPFADIVGPKGSVSALDIAEDSIELLKARLKPGSNVQAIVSDMANTGHHIAETFSTKKYDLCHASYSLYYCLDREGVLDSMRAALKPGGRVAIFNPNAPHGLVELASRYTKIPAPVAESLEFGPTVLEPYFKKAFGRCDVHHFHNVVTLPSSDLMLEFYRQTTYYDPEAEAGMRAEVDAAIERDGNWSYEKNGYLIIGRDPK
jgi:ubiquinone/menaquinone biosynthesis C-methylase UbiE